VLQFIVIFSLSVAGSLVALSAELAHRFFRRKTRSELMTAGPVTGTGRPAGRAGAAESIPGTDPVVTFGSILACYGALALALVGALPAPLALERTVLTFAFLCVGGLLGEIAKSSSTLPTEADPDAVEREITPREPPSRGLSFTLALVLNLAFAVLGAGQGLIDIVPPAGTAKAAANSQELQPILVVAERPAAGRERGVEL
jgi:hypothetical protein